MKRTLLLLAFLLMFGAFAAAQAPSIPTCDGYDATTNAPIVKATGSTFCTDFFGVVNWANSPLPSGQIVSYTVLAGGSGYHAPTVLITDIAGTGASASIAGLDPTGAITGITTGNFGNNYMMPVVTIVDTNCGLAGQLPCGSGAMVTANIGGTITGGIKKFVDPLPDLKTLIATPDTTTFPGSDFYIIGLGDYTTQTFHSSLPPTKLRGYCQLASAAATTCGTQSYLGPVILAQKDRPVRVLFKNLLPTGAGGDLFIPVDPTYMGANDTQNRATLHLHGGATPWISDGTPHQWTKPAGEVGPSRGVSTAFVPDMWFLNGAIVPAGTPGASNDPGPGNMTFYWTNAQGGRLMFYHDHAYGLTRLNVYAGEAAGYLLYDPAEESALLAGGAPGTIAVNSTQTAPDLAHLIPLVIQDKTFVPSTTQINATDPTWGGQGVAFGASPLNPAANGNGDLWFPHVYMPNQNPNDPITGASGFGHWDYGAWFFPPMTTLTAGPNGAVTIPCASSVAGGQTWQCPIIPNPSGTPESFMDTPVVNGKAYPVLHVAPEAYRFRILSAGNDRSWNLSWFVADATQNNTEVVMMPAVAPTTGSALPLCTTVTPVAVPPLILGLTTGLLDGTGQPLNGTGLPANCWPNYGPQAGIPATQAMWAGDGRAGGVPDPRTAGPAWVEIGTEGGLLPAPVVIPATPVNYEQNTRSITIGSVAMHGLWLGPAERADAIVDFSKFAGKTLILYNDAPAPAPAIDSRLDYFTGDGDQTPIGGAPNTLPGYGPNTRTVMQVVVDAPTAGGKPLSLPALRGAFATSAAGNGVFAATQPKIIVPEPGYNSAYNGVFTSKYMGIHDNNMTFTPLAPLNFESLLSAEPSTCATVPVPPIQCASYNQKAIQELFTLDYGRMNATLGTELPLTNFQNQTTIPLGYVDPSTEIVRQGDTQLWKITHNGVDTHFIHFHLFNVQVVNRVGWDGSVRQPDANELGWKETVRMNPLEDIMVALQPITPPTPWPLPNSVRQNDVTAIPGSSMNFSNLNPFSNAGAITQDGPTNFGWEYVWHCHILGHEENDMMRPILWQVPPPAPANLTAVPDLVNGGVKLSWTDKSASETGFAIQRDTNPGFPNPVTISAAASLTRNAAGEGIDWGAIQTTTDNSSLTAGTNYYYRVQAIDDGFKAPFEQSYNVTSALLSGWSNTAQILPAPIAGITPTVLAFGNVTVGSTTQTLAGGQLAQVTISNTGNADLTLVAVQSGSADFGSNASGCVTVTPGATCVFTVTYSPLTIGPAAGTITFTTNDTANPTLVVSMSGTGVVTTAIGINAPTVTYNADGLVTLTVTATPSGTPSGNVTLSVDGGAAISQALTAGVSAFTITAPNAGNHTLLANYAAQNGFLASTATGTLTVNPAALTIAPTPNPATMTFGGAVPALTPSYTGFVAGQGPANLTGTATCSTTATATSPVGAYTSVCAGATSTNYAISYPQGAVNVVKATSAVAITSNRPNPAIIGQIVTVSFNVAPQFSGTPTGSVTVTASTGETCSGALTGGAGSCTLTFATGGSRTLTATYAGDVNFLGSGPSAAVTQTVSNISLSTTSLLFGNQMVGTRSAAQTVTLSNVGTTPLTISSITWTANFSDATNCGTTLLAGRSCRINVVFAPTTTGVLTGTLTITDSDVTSPQSVTLTGTGVSAAVSVTPTALSFSSAVNVTTAAQTVTVANTGTAPVTINSLGGLGTQFAQTNTCGAFPAVLAVGANCTINVTFTPTSAGTKNATMTVGFAAPVASQSVSLSGTVIVPTFTLAPGTLAFGGVTRNTTSAPQVITVTNTSTVALAINNIRTAGGNANQFRQTNNCGTSLAAGSTCTVNVTFAPTSRGLKNSTLQVNVAAPAVSQSATLSGTGL